MAKLLPGTSSSLVKVNKPLPIKTNKLVLPSKSSGGNTLLSIQKKVIKVDKLLKDSLILKKKDTEKKRVKKEGEKFDESEKQLESKKLPKVKGINLPTPPKLGIFDWIKNFIFNTLFGFIAIRLIDHLPKLLSILPTLMKAADFIIDFGGKLLDGLVTFIDWGYKAYDATRGFVKNLFGEGGVKKFDELSSVLNKFLNLALIAGMLAAGSGRGGFGGKGGSGKGGPAARPRPGQGGRPRVTTTGGGGAGRPDIRNPLRQRPTVTTGKGGKPGGLRLPGTGPRVTGGGGPKIKLPKGIKARGGLLGLMFLIPDLIESGMLVSQGRGKDGLRTLLSAVSGVVAGMAAYSATIAGAGALGITGVGLPAAIALAVAGFGASTLAGSAAYNLADAGLKKMGLVDKDPKTGKPYAYKSGGRTVTRGGRRPVTRTLTKKKKARTLSFTPPKIKPGRSSGGEDKVQQVFPNPAKPGGLFGFLGGLFGGGDQQKDQQQTQQKPKEKTANPQEFLIKSNDVLGKADFFGPFFTLALKSVLGDKPNKLDYLNTGKGLNAWMQTVFRTGPLGFAGGGEVDAKRFFSGEDYTDVITKSVEDSVSDRVDNTIRDLAKELALRPSGKEEMIQENIRRGQEGDEGDEGGFEVGPAGSSGDKLTMARNLMRDLGLTAAQAAGIVGNMAAESGVENARPQGSRPGTKAPLKVDGVTGYGLVQWTSKGRQQALANFARSKGSDLSKPLSMDIEYQFFLKEFKGAYGHVFEQIKKAPDTKTASTIFMQQYEVPAGYKTEAKIMERYNMSKPIYDKLARGEGKATEGRGTYISPSGENLSSVQRGDPSQAASRLLKDFPGIKSRRNSQQIYAAGLGYWMKKNFPTPGEPGRRGRGDYGDPPGGDMEHPDHGGVVARHRGQGHRKGQALDLGGFGDPSGKDQDKMWPYIARFLKIYGLDNKNTVPVVYSAQQEHYAPSAPGSGYLPGHDNHLHVEFAHGGETPGSPTPAIVGDGKGSNAGPEYVIDADSYRATEKVAPGLLDILNYNVNDKASLQKNMPSIIASLSKYTSYEDQTETIVMVDNDMQQQQSDYDYSVEPMKVSMGNRGIDNTDYETLEML